MVVGVLGQFKFLYVHSLHPCLRVFGRWSSTLFNLFFKYNSRLSLDVCFYPFFIFASFVV